MQEKSVLSQPFYCWEEVKSKDPGQGPYVTHCMDVGPLNGKARRIQLQTFQQRWCQPGATSRSPLHLENPYLKDYDLQDHSKKVLYYHRGQIAQRCGKLDPIFSKSSHNK